MSNHPLIQDWLEATATVRIAREAENKAYFAAIAAPLPPHRRPASPSDIVEGAIIWYPGWGEDEGIANWKLVSEVLRPNDPWKAFCAEDGCRYGLDGAYVEVDLEEFGFSL